MMPHNEIDGVAQQQLFIYYDKLALRFQIGYQARCATCRLIRICSHSL